MTMKVFPPKVAEFVRDYWPSASHRRMLYLGHVMTKVSALFQLTDDDDVPEEATCVFILLLEGLQSGDEAEYARCEAAAMAIYHEWLAGREVH